MKKTFFLLFLSLLFITSCSDDKEGFIEPIQPLISQILNGTDVVGDELLIEATTNLKLTVETKDNDIVKYVWAHNGVVIDGATTNALNITPKYSGNLQVSLTNESGLSTTKEIKLNGLYKDGVLFYSSTNIGFSFFDGVKTVYEDNVYSTVNDGEELGAGGINDLYIFNNKMYILVPSSKDNKARVVIADAQTLAKIDIVEADGFTTKELGEIYNLVIADDNTAYIGHNNSNYAAGTNQSAVKVLNLKDKKLGGNIDGVAGDLGIGGPSWSRMLKVEDKVLIAAGNKIQIVDVKLHKVINTIQMHEDRQVVDIVKGRDNRIFAVVEGELKKVGGSWLWGATPTTAASIIEVNLEDSKIISEKELLIDGKKISIGSGLGSAKTTASLSSDEIFFVEGGWTASKVYKFNYTTGVTSLFIDKSKASGLNNNFSGYLAAGNDGRLYVPTTNYTSSVVGVFSIIDGVQQTDYTINLPGDANATVTSRF